MKNIAILSVLVLLTSCAVDIDYYMPANRFDTPETSGKPFAGKVEIQYMDAHQVNLGEVWDDIVFSTGSTTDDGVAVSKEPTMGIGLDLGIHERVDAFYRSTYDATNILGLKFQFWGSSKRESKEGLKLAVTAGAGKDTLDDEEVTVDDGDGNTKKLSSNLESKAIDFSFIAGYRFNDYVLIYLNNFYTKYWLDGSIQEDGQEALSAKGQSENYGSLLGARLGSRWYITPEIGISKANYEEKNQTIETFGLALGFSW